MSAYIKLRGVKMVSNEKGLQISGLYQHYKGGVYQVLDIAIHSETGEELVLYKDQSNITYARPKTMFLEDVSPGVPRFRYLDWISSKEDEALSKAFFAVTPVRAPRRGIQLLRDPKNKVSLRYTLLEPDVISGIEVVLDTDVNVGISLRPHGMSLQKDVFQLRGDLIVSLAALICPTTVMFQTQKSQDNRDKILKGYLVEGVFVAGDIRPLIAIYYSSFGRITKILLRFTDDLGGEFLAEDRRPEEMNAVIYWLALLLSQGNTQMKVGGD